MSFHPTGHEGSNIINDLPSSSTVLEKSVPLTPIVAVGVVTNTC